MIDRTKAGTMLWEHMKETGVGKNELAKMIGITAPTLGNILRGSVIPQFRACAKIERFFDEVKDKKNQRNINE